VARGEQRRSLSRLAIVDTWARPLFQAPLATKCTRSARPASTFIGLIASRLSKLSQPADLAFMAYAGTPNSTKCHVPVTRRSFSQHGLLNAPLAKSGGFALVTCSVADTNLHPSIRVQKPSKGVRRSLQGHRSHWGPMIALPAILTFVSRDPYQFDEGLSSSGGAAANSTDDFVQPAARATRRYSPGTKRVTFRQSLSLWPQPTTPCVGSTQTHFVEAMLLLGNRCCEIEGDRWTARATEMLAQVKSGRRWDCSFTSSFGEINSAAQRLWQTTWQKQSKPATSL